MINRFILTSVITSTSILSSNIYANTIKDAFKNGTVKGDIKAYYFQEDYDKTGRSSILHFGGLFSYKTADFYGLKAGITFQVSSVNNIDGVNKFINDEDASGTVMSEAFLEYARSNTSLKVGRQFIGTPLLAGSGSRMIRQAFQGYTLVNKDIQDTILTAIYVDRFQKRTDAAGKTGTFTKSFNTNSPVKAMILEDGAYSFYLQNKSVDNLATRLQYLNAVNIFKIYYADGLYKIGTKANISVKAQYIGTDHNNNSSNGNFYALRLYTKYDFMSLNVSASTNPSNANVQSGIGFGADTALTGSKIAGGYFSYLEDTKAYKINVGTKLSTVKFNIIHSHYNTETGPNKKETDFLLSYYITQDFNLEILHAKFQKVPDRNFESRVKLTYKF